MSKNKSSANTAKNTLANLVKVSTLLLVGLFLNSSQFAFAKAYHATLREMIERSDAIAIADVGPVKTIKEKGQTFNYSQESQVNLLESLKGKLPKSFTLRGGEDFICAQVHFTEGKNILFLKKENDYFKGTNWDSSCLAVKDNKVRWFNNAEERHTSKEVNLESAIKDIKDIISGKMVNMKLPDYLDNLCKAEEFADQIRGEAPFDRPQWVAYKQAKTNSATIKKELEYIASKGTPAAKLYAACALVASDKKAGIDLLAKLKSSKEDVIYRSGCRGINVTVGTIATSLVDTGKYINFSLDK